MDKNNKFNEEIINLISQGDNNRVEFRRHSNDSNLLAGYIIICKRIWR
ncbi:hypothetical protein [Acetobacterium bakii]|nr:hypothetical protein [Acetobacterium bakii]